MLMLILGFAFVMLVLTAVYRSGEMNERRKWEGRILKRTGLLDDPAPGPTADRFERLESAVDAVAIELERLGEGQRFVTKLLSNRARSEHTPPSPQPGAVRAVRPPSS